MWLLKKVAFIVHTTFLKSGQQCLCIFDESLARRAPINTKPFVFKAR